MCDDDDDDDKLPVSHALLCCVAAARGFLAALLSHSFSDVGSSLIAPHRKRRKQRRTSQAYPFAAFVPAEGVLDS